MTSKSKIYGLLTFLLCLSAVALWYFGDDHPNLGPGAGARTDLDRDPAGIPGVRGVVLDVKTRRPIGGIEVVALRVLPNLERPITRFRSLFREGI